MKNLVLKWLRLHEEETAAFLWSAALLFLMRSSGMILNNYAETAFLKRYGVEYLPIVNMLNSAATFAVTALLAVFIAKVAGNRLLAIVFVFCGVTVGALRFVIPLGYELVYPVLFMLKSQFELLEALLFWNLANDLFNTRQSKRIFPLLTAGGVIGLIAGSFGTPYLAAVLRFDNLLIVYLGLSLAGALTIKGMGIHVRLRPGRGKGRRKKTATSQPPFTEQIKTVLPLIRQSALVKIVLVLTFMPNVVIPIMNYQFNYAADAYFASESGLLEFFSYLRGALNIIILFILLFVGRFYSRFGLPVALMFHPFNYIIAFFAFLLRFDIFSAVYARMSTNIMRTAINMPANSILIGLFPESYRAFVRPFLRGTVVRAALFLGSGIILVSTPYFHPRYLSVVALPFVLAWMCAPLVLRKKYSSILMDLVSSNMLDLKSLEEQDPGNLFRQEKAGGELVSAFLKSQGEDALWYARLLKTLNIGQTDELILEAVRSHRMPVKKQLLEMLSDNPGPGAAKALENMFYTSSDPEFTEALIRKIKRSGLAGPKIKTRLESLIMHPDPGLRGHAAGCLYDEAPGKIKPKIDAWLRSDRPKQKKAGIIAAGQTMEKGYAAVLESMLKRNENQPLHADILAALGRIAPENMNQIAEPFLDNPDPAIRKEALNTTSITDEYRLGHAVNRLGDSREEIRNLAREKIKNAPYVNGRVLIEALNRPGRRIREAVFELLETLEIKDTDLAAYATRKLEEAYVCICRAVALRRLPATRCKDLLEEHLLRKKDLILENTFRALTARDESGRMRKAFLGLFSKNHRQRANSIELMADVMDRKLFSMAEPLVEGTSVSRTAEAGRKFFRLPGYRSLSRELFPELINSGDWLETVLALCIMGRHAELAERLKKETAGLLSSPNPDVRQMARKLVPADGGTLDPEEQIMDNKLNAAEKILLLRNVSIFSGLSVSELGAIAAITEEVDFEEDQVVIAEGDSGDSVYLIIEGEVAVIKGRNAEHQIRLDTMGQGDYFGEMALFEETERSATIKTLEKSRFLILDKQEFNELVRQYPEIALRICTALSRRLRHLHGRLAEAEGITDQQGKD